MLAVALVVLLAAPPEYAPLTAPDAGRSKPKSKTPMVDAGSPPPPPPPAGRSPRSVRGTSE